MITKMPKSLRQLQAQGRVAYTTLRRDILNELLQFKLVAVQVNGSRRTVVVQDDAGLNAWLAARFPTLETVASLPQRAANIATQRSSKRGTTTHGIQPILLKWFSADASLPSTLTQQFGLMAATTETVATLPWGSADVIILMENWEPFQMLNTEKKSGAAVVVYLGGNVSDVTLVAIAQVLKQCSPFIWCCCDYDWAGLRIFQRVKTQLPQARLFIPENIVVLFGRYGRYDLHQQPIGTLAESLDSDIQTISQLISEHNAGLEQEIVPLSAYIQLTQ